MRRGMYLALGVLVFLATLTPASDTDLWWHLAAGREMLARGAFLRADPFTLSAAGRPWIDLHWLFQLSVYGLYQWQGLIGLVVAKAVLVAAGAMILLALVERGTAETVAGPLFVVVMGAAMFFARHLVLVRPVIFTLVFLALFLLLLEGYARGDNPRRLWWLPLLQVIWVNSQGLFALGPAVILCYAMGGAVGQRLGAAELPARGTRTLLAVTGLCFAACLLTPYGLAGLWLPIKLLLRLSPSDSNVFSANIAENVPPWVLQRTAPGLMAPFHWWLGLVGASFVVARRQVRIGRSLVVLAFAGLALLANRNVLLFFWMATPMAVLNVAPGLARGLGWLAARGHPVLVKRAAAALALAGFAGVLGLIGAARAHETPIAAPAPFRIPAAAIEHLPAQPPGGRPGRVFTADHYGGYLTWARHPHYLPFIDTRLVLHTGDEYAEFLGLLDNPERWEQWQQRQQFDHVLVPSAFPDRYLGLIQHLAAAPDWRLDFTDGTQVLFSHRPGGGPGLDLGDAAVVQGILAGLDQQGPRQDEPGRAARRHLARLLLLLGHVATSRDVLASLPADDVDGQALLARSFLLEGNLAQAQAIGERLLAQIEADDDAAQPLVSNLLALTALARGDVPEALGHLRRALTIDPFDGEARALLERLEAEQRRAVGGPQGLP